MSEQPPRVKLPEAIPRKPVIPGPNSWAQSLENQQNVSIDHGHDQPTNRDKYESKPMPQIPREPSRNNVSQPKTYVQPAIPLVNPVASHKARAVTDPVTPKPLFTNRKASVTQLRKKFSSTKDDAANEDTKLPPAISQVSEKAAQILGMSNIPEDKKRSTNPVSAASKNPVSSEEFSDELTKQACQVQSTPVLTRRHLREDNLHTFTAATPFTPKQDAKLGGHNADLKPRNPGGFAIRDENLRSPKIATYGEIGEIHVVQEDGMHRAERCCGVIENATDIATASGASESPPSPKPTIDSSKGIAAQAKDKGELLQPSVYSPSNYDGVWENDPAVGHTLPPFTPMLRLPPHGRDFSSQNPDVNASISVSSSFRNEYGNVRHTNDAPNQSLDQHQPQYTSQDTRHLTEYQLPLPSAISWASGSRGNSFTSTDAPISAILPPRWPNHHASNSVPSPPYSQRDYQRPGPLSAGLAQLDLTLHHHIDTAFGALSRLITDKHDRILDQTIRRLDNMDEALGKGMRGLKGETKSLKNDVGGMKLATNEIGKVLEGMKDSMKGFENKLNALERHVEAHERQCSHTVTEQNNRELEADRHERPTAPRRTESAHGALGQGEQRQQYQSGASCSSSKARQSGASSGRHRSNTLNAQPGARMNDERATRRDDYAETTAGRGAMPDLRDHPAYAGVQHGGGRRFALGENGVPRGMAMTNAVTYAHQPLGDGGWYHQAYGQGL